MAVLGENSRENYKNHLLVTFGINFWVYSFLSRFAILSNA